MSPWTALSSHRAWLQGEFERLLGFGRPQIARPTGAAWLDASGRPTDQVPETWLTARAVHVHALGALAGIPGSAPVAAASLAALAGPLRDEADGGWFHTADRDPAQGKQAYDHAFVVLAATSAQVAGIPGAEALLEDALAVLEERFLDADGLVVDSWDAGFAVASDYRGINSTMHTVEALLAAGDVAGPIWHERAARLAGFAIVRASEHGWRLPEHYAADWTVLPEYNDDRRDDQFRPYGATVGHALEWARLILHLEAALGTDHPAFAELPASPLEAALALYDRAVADGWSADGAPGFVYTTDWSGVPVTHDRLHWVLAEAIGAAAALHERTGEARFAADYAAWWDHAEEYFLDREEGSWHHQLDRSNRVARTVWPGKPDLYHAVQATLVPRLPLAPSMASAIAEGALR